MKSRRVIITLLAATLSAPLAYGVVSGQVSADETEKRESDTTAAIAIDEKHFPDANFRDLVKTADTDKNGSLSDTEMKDVDFFSCEDYNIRSCKGIEYFPNLMLFYCSNNKITELDLSKNTKLQLLACAENQLTELDLSHNLKLEALYCGFNKLTKLDCSKLSNLISLDCMGDCEEKDGKGVSKGSLTSLDISGCKNLQYLTVVGNKLTKLDISNNPDLRELYCSINQLEELDLRNQTKLEQLGCAFNKLTSLDVSPAEYLSYLQFSGNKFESIDLSHNKNLYELRCDYAGLTSLDLSGLYRLATIVSHGNQLKTLDIGDTKIADAYDFSKVEDQGTYYEFSYEQEDEYGGYVSYYLTFDKATEVKSELHNDIVCKIDSTTFPDPSFRKFVQGKYDLNHDKKLSVMEIARVEAMDLGANSDDRSEGIKSVKGIEYFTNLYDLQVYGTKLEEFAPSKMESLMTFAYYGGDMEDPSDYGSLKKLDTSGCEKLEYITVMNCAISSLNASRNANLKFLAIGNLAIESLDLSGVTSLMQLEITDCNRLKSLVFKNNVGLVGFSLIGEGLHELDLSQCPNLSGLTCSHSNISSLDLSKCPNLESLLCAESPISSLDLSCVPKLTDLSLTNLPMNNLDLSCVPKLFALYLNDMRITKLDLSKLSELVNVHIEKTDLVTLDFSHNRKIVDLDLLSCGLKSVDISSLSHLQFLDVSDNEITKLDISHCSNLVSVHCYNNSIQSLECKAEFLDTLSCACNDLMRLDMSHCPNLSYLDCSYNSNLSKLKISKNTELNSLYCGHCNLSSLKLPDTMLAELSCGGNDITDLDLSKQTNLYFLDLHSMNLIELDLKRMEKLEYLDLRDNLLSKIEINKHAPLYYADLRFNLFSEDPKISADEYGFEPQKYVAQPQGFHLVSKDQKSISLAWDKAEHAERYEIYRSTALDGEYILAGSVTECAFSDTKIDPAQTYYYYVCGIRSLEEYEAGLGEWYSDPSEILVVGEAGDPTPTPSDDATFEEFVERLYTVALNRKSDAEGKKFWIDQVVNQGKTGADCARFFLLDAPEFMQRNLSVEDFVETLYKTFFDRESDAAGKKGWVEAIKTGAKTRAEVVNDFIESTEWCNVCATYGVKSGAQWHKATKASKNATNFATRLYTCCLKRDAEQGGLSYWSLALTNLEKTGAQAAQFFFESEEFVGFNTTLNDYLNRLYTTFMDRQPAASEIEYWVGEVKAGRQNRHSILAFFAQSPEFSEICKKYGIDRGQIG